MESQLISTIQDLKAKATTFFQVGIAAADPYQAVRRCLIADEKKLALVLDNGITRTDNWSKIHLIAFGKAAYPMMSAALDSIPQHYLSGKAIAVTNYENVKTIADVNVMGAGHPLPDAAGLQAGRLCAELAENAEAGELVLVLVSGGGSALIPYPVAPISLAEKIKVTDLLLASGATIHEMNCVRKHLSQLKGGGLARLIAPADMHTLILSDVMGDELSVIASGPTVPDDTTFQQAKAVLENKALWQIMPERVKDHLARGVRGLVSETPKQEDCIFSNSSHCLIGSNKISVEAVIKAVSEQGFEAKLYSDKLSGEAREVAEELVIFAKERQLNSFGQALAIIAGGETTVTLKGKGRGGRNQEMALAFAIGAEKHQLSGNWVFLSGGTDGRDGPTDAAGGLVDSGTMGRLETVGIQAKEMLANNDSYAALQASQDLLVTGATGTNVADLQILLLQD